MTDHRIFTATLPTGQEVLVRVYDVGGEIAFRARPEPSITWGVPTPLVEERT